MITVVTNASPVDEIDYEHTDAVMLVVCRNQAFEPLKREIMRRCAEHFIPFHLMFVIPETNNITFEMLYGLGTTIDPETTCILPSESAETGQAD